MKHERLDMAKYKAIYTYSMHPEVKATNFVECPKYSIKMVEKKMYMKKKKDDKYNQHKH